jgi:hypothetical protein
VTPSPTDDSDDIGGAFGEVLDLCDGRTIEVRATRAGDGPLLHDFYTPLPTHDVYRRFFSAWHPSEDWCEEWATVGERGGFGVLALLNEASGENRVIAEAGYAMRRDGDGDLAVTVDPEWRGWLGAYLVDVLVRHAAANGIENLQAEVLLENRPMLTVLRHRGAVNLEHVDGEVRLTIGTHGYVPSWPVEADGVRILVEVGSGRWAGESAAAEAGAVTAMCSGPARRTRRPCPLLAGEPCPLAERADAIVVLLDPDDPTTDELIAAHRRRRPGIPVFVAPRREGAPDHDASCIEVSGDGGETVDRILSLVAGRDAAPDAPADG